MRPVKKCKIVVIIGPAGSGKTALAANYPGHVIFDNDRMIEAVWGTLQYHPAIKRMAKGMVREGMRRAMKAGLAFVIPISGRTKKERAKVISIAREYDYQVVVVKAVATPEECLVRCKADKNRPKTTKWEPIIKRWFDVFEPVSNDEYDIYQEAIADSGRTG